MSSKSSPLTDSLSSEGTPPVQIPTPLPFQNPANFNFPLPLSLLPIDLTKPHVIPAHATIRPYRLSSHMGAYWAKEYRTGPLRSEIVYEAEHFTPYLAKFFSDVEEGGLFTGKLDLRNVCPELDVGKALAEVELGDKTVSSISRMAISIPMRPLLPLLADLRHSTSSHKDDITKPDRVIYSRILSGAFYMGRQLERIVWGVIEIKFLPPAPASSARPRPWDDDMQRSIREGLYKLLWHVYLAHKLCGTRLGLALINEFFVRVVVKSGGKVIMVETGDEVLEEMVAGGYLQTLAVEVFDELDGFWRRPANSLLFRESWELCAQNRARLDAAILSMLIASDSDINPFPPPSHSSTSTSFSDGATSVTSALSHSKDLDDSERADGGWGAGGGGEAEGDGEDGGGEATTNPPSPLNESSSSTHPHPSPTFPLSPTTTSHRSLHNEKPVYNKEEALADLSLADGDTGELPWMAFRALLYLNGLQIKLVSREVMDVAFARCGHKG
ncbi:hypothetical protein IAT38_004814 [Cryptococcus sp. DSM 104549]